MFTFVNLRKIVNQIVTLFDLSKYSNNNAFSFSIVIRINAIRTQFSSTFIKSSISISLISSILFNAVQKRRENLSTILCFLFDIC